MTLARLSVNKKSAARQGSMVCGQKAKAKRVVNMNRGLPWILNKEESRN
jgi:hypothetical protein